MAFLLCPYPSELKSPDIVKKYFLMKKWLLKKKQNKTKQQITSDLSFVSFGSSVQVSLLLFWRISKSFLNVSSRWPSLLQII